MKHILCYGDSNTWGYIPVTGGRYDEHTRWTGVLQDRLGDGWRVHEEGLNSRTTVYDECTKPFLNGISTLPAVLASQKPLDAVVLCLGTNDLKHVTADESVNGLMRLVRLIRSFDTLYPSSTPVLRGGKRIVILGPIGIGEAAGTFNPQNGNDAVRAEAARFPVLLEALCRREKLEFIDLQRFAAPSEADGIHMTDAGHRAVGEAVAERLLTLL